MTTAPAGQQPNPALATLQRFLGNYFSAGTPQAAVENAQRLHNAVEALTDDSGNAAVLAEFLGSEQAVAAASQPSGPGTWLHQHASRTQHDTHQLQQSTSCIPALLGSAASSLVASALLRCLLVESVIIRLGSSQAYRLASSLVGNVVDSATKASQAVADLCVAERQPVESAASLPTATLLVKVLCAHMTGTDRALQFLEFQIGSQLQCALLRTVCPHAKLIKLWSNIIGSLAAVDKLSGHVSRSFKIWALLYSLSLRWPHDTYASTAFAPRHWVSLQQLCDGRMLQLLATTHSSHQGECGAGEQWLHVLTMVKDATKCLVAAAALPVSNQPRNPSGAWSMKGKHHTLALLSASTLTLLRAQDRRSRNEQNCPQHCRNEAAPTMAATALFYCVNLALLQGSSTSQSQPLAIMEALTAALAALQSLAAEATAAGPVAEEAASFLKLMAGPALALFRGLGADRLQCKGPAESLEQAVHFAGATGKAAEAAIRLTATVAPLEASSSMPQELIKSLSCHCMHLAHLLAFACQVAWAKCFELWMPGCHASNLQHQAAAAVLNMGLSAAKLSMVLSKLPGFGQSSTSRPLQGELKSTVHWCCHACLAALICPALPKEAMACVLDSLRAAAPDVLMWPPLESGWQAELSMRLTAISSGVGALWGSCQLEEDLMKAATTLFKQALEAQGPLPIATMLRQTAGFFPNAPRLVFHFGTNGCLENLLSYAKRLPSNTLLRREEKLAPLEAFRDLLVAASSALRESLSHVTNLLPQPAYASQLGRLKQATRAQLCSRKFWEHTVEEGLLPTLHSRAAAAEEMWQAQQLHQEPQKDESYQEPATLLVLALRPCANLLCTNVRGCSEGRLHSRRCSGCRVVRYCSRDCQLQHWPEHGPFCAALADAAAQWVAAGSKSGAD